MAEYDYSPQTFDGEDLTASPFTRVFFRPANSPVTSRPMSPVSAAVVDLGTQDVRAQPKAKVWELHCILTGSTEALLLLFHKVFSEDRGSVYLVANDGDAAAWRVACRVIGVDRHPGNKAYFIVKLWVPNPLWEENAVDTDSQLNVSGDSKDITVVNSGNRKAKPTIYSINPDSNKDTLVHDWKYSLRGFVVNRSPRALRNYPVQLFSTADAGGNYDTAALVKVAGTTAELNGGINDTVTSIAFDADGGLDSPDGMIYIEDEQIYYTGNDGSTLTGCVRGIGGTAAASHSDPNTITKSLMLENGDDLAVWVNGKQVERWLADMNTANTKLWINVSTPPRKIVTLKADITAASPADAGDLEIVEDISELPESGQVVIDDEMISWQSRDLAARKLKTIERGAWGTTAAIHTTSDSVYRCDILYIIGHGKAKNGTVSGDGLGPPEASTGRRPAIQLPSSLPNKWYIGDESDDPNTAFYDPSYPDRSAMFRPSKKQASDDLAQALRLQQSEDQAGFQDSDPAAGKLDTNRLTLSLDVPIEAIASGVSYDVQKRADIRMLIRGRDESGLEVDLANEQDVDEGHDAGSTLTPTARLTELSLMAVRSFVCGNKAFGTGKLLASNGVDQPIYQKFVLDQFTLIKGIQVYLALAAGNDGTLNLYIRDNTDAADPRNGNRIATIVEGATITAEATKRYGYTPASPLALAAGTYWLEFDSDAGGGIGSLDVRGGAPSTKHDLCYFVDGSPALEYGYVAWFRLIHEVDGPIQPGAEEFNANVEADFDKLILLLDDAAADNMVPQIRREAAFGELLAHCNAVITNDKNSKQITIDAWILIGAASALVIDCEAQTGTWAIGNQQFAVPVAIDAADDAAWLELEPGTNTLTHTENNMVDHDLVVQHRGKRV